VAVLGGLIVVALGGQFHCPTLDSCPQQRVPESILQEQPSTGEA